MEEWRPIVGYEELYEVSNCGRVRSLPKAVVTTAGNGELPHLAFRRERIMKLQYRKGYAGVGLTKDGQQTIHRVHRLMLVAFVGPPPSAEATLACHKDGSQQNVVDNLYWGTPQQNIDDVYAHGRKTYNLMRPQRKTA